MNEFQKNMTQFTKDTWKKGGKEIATKVIPVVLTGISGIIIKIINQEKWGQINDWKIRNKIIK